MPMQFSDIRDYRCSAFQFCFKFLAKWSIFSYKFCISDQKILRNNKNFLTG